MPLRNRAAQCVAGESQGREQNIFMTEPLEKSTGEPASHSPAPPAPDDGEGNPSLVAEFVIFIRENRKWWLIPMILMIAILGLLIVCGTSTVLAPFIYSLF